eukprot:GHVP01019165.1.p2 GENE.GHVP01019165.1~~GHVP01019165.1.p2  ORF type:complete len:150 (-),score=34.06 GHVP01019165.1:1064-1513(-)
MSEVLSGETPPNAPLRVDELLRNLDATIQHLVSTIRTLNVAKMKFEKSKEAVQEIKSRKKGSELLVPLTTSLYVEGELENNELLTVDVGAGYHIEMTYSDTDNYLDRRCSQLGGEISKLEKNLNEKVQFKQNIQKAALQAAENQKKTTN